MVGRRASFARHPTLHYCLLMVLGGFGVYISMPIFFHPQSTIEWIDLAINLIIFIPCSLVAVVSGVLAALSAAFSFQIDEEGRFAKFAHIVLKTFGIPGLLLPEFAALTPLGFMGAILTKRSFGRSISTASIPQADEHEPMET